MSKVIPLSVPDDLLAEIRQTAEETNLSMQDVFRQSARLGIPKLRESLTVARPEGYFADDYPEPEDRRQLRAALGAVPHRERK